MIKIQDIRIQPGQGEKTLRRIVYERLALDVEDVRDFRILHQAIDARDKKEIRLIYTVAFRVTPYKENEILSLGHKKAGEIYYRGLKIARMEKEPVYEPASPGQEQLTGRPVVVGFGPCGMFAALTLAEAGYKPLVLERGTRMEERVRDVEGFWNGGPLKPESNVQFGEGGAGTFSDGKLTTGTHNPRIGKVLDELAKASGRDELRYEKKPHIGTDELRKVVVTIRKRIEELGGEIRFNQKVIGWETEAGCVSERLKTLLVLDTKTGEEIRIEAGAAIFALGHSARDSWRSFREKNLRMEPKPFSIGVRAEHLQSMIDVSQYGRSAKELKLEPADYKLAVRVPVTERNTGAGGASEETGKQSIAGESGRGRSSASTNSPEENKAPDTRGVYTFCMCPGGTVVAAASEEGMVVTNGMSYRDRGGKNANSAVLVDVRPEDYLKRRPDGRLYTEGEAEYDPLSGVAFQEKYERLAFELGGRNFAAPAERLGDFLAGKTAEELRGEAAAKKRTEENRPVTFTEEGKEEIPYRKSESPASPFQSANPSPAPTYRRGVNRTDISGCLPDFCSEALRKAFPLFGRKIKGFDRPDTILTAVETRSSSPVRIPRSEEGLAYLEDRRTTNGKPELVKCFRGEKPGASEMQSVPGTEHTDTEDRRVLNGFYPAGEGAGYAGGIVSAAVDGIRQAEAIIRRYRKEL